VIALIILAIWFTGWTVTARRLFLRWRPGRVPLCNRRHHGGHSRYCYRRIMPDRNAVAIDSDSEAAGWAMLAGIVWPMVALVFLLMRNPPPLPEEKAKAMEDMERDAGIGQ
jgi:hypothetical protein